jgi:hypothetical protein
MDVLSGPDTEAALKTQLQEALRTNVSCKVAITHYTASRKKFLDFVAFRACGGYTFAVHCPGGSPTLLEDVKVRFTFISRLLLLLAVSNRIYFFFFIPLVVDGGRRDAADELHRQGAAGA